jgi:uncharacterized protein (UPF0212 family)
MKKKLAGILAVLMVLSMGMTVFAAPSPSKESDMKKEAEKLVTTVQSGDTAVTLTPSTVQTADLEEAYDFIKQKIGATEYSVLAAVELSSANTLPDGGLQITFAVTGVTSGEANIRIYHKKSIGWEVKTPYVGDGFVYATFDSLSPFFVVRYDTTSSVNDGSADSSAVVNNYYNTYNTNSNNITSNTSTNNSTNNTNSNNPATTNYTNSNNTNSNNTTTTNNAASSSSSTKKSTSSSNTSSSKKSSTSTTDKVSAKSAGDGNSGTNNQTVTVNVNGDGSSSGKAGVSTSTTSPKTGSSMPALPMIAIFAVMGIAFCGKKARSL